jgi:hypothetical protein
LFYYETECDDYFKKSLFFVGEIGGNDILSHVLTNKPVTKIREIVPLMVEEIANTASVCYVNFKILMFDPTIRTYSLLYIIK